VTPSSGVIIGVAAGVICFFSSTTVKKAFGYDDSLDAFGVHCIGGIIGALLTGALVSKDISGVDGSVETQLWGVGTTLIYGFVMSMLILKVLDLTIGLRVMPEEEREGLDISQHGESIE
jgi:Amt family ammonium transporter